MSFLPLDIHRVLLTPLKRMGVANDADATTNTNLEKNKGLYYTNRNKFNNSIQSD